MIKIHVFSLKNIYYFYLFKGETGKCNAPDRL